MYCAGANLAPSNWSSATADSLSVGVSWRLEVSIFPYVRQRTERFPGSWRQSQIDDVAACASVIRGNFISNEQANPFSPLMRTVAGNGPDHTCGLRAAALLGVTLPPVGGGAEFEVGSK